MHIWIEASECKFQPAPGNCATKDYVPVEEDTKWENRCLDIHGNIS